MSAPLTHGLIIGATSSLAVALCRSLAAQGAALALCGRDVEELQVLAQDLRIRYGVPTAALAADMAMEPLPAAALIEAAEQAIGKLDFMVVAVGEMKGNADDPAAIAHLMRINYLAPALLMTEAAARFARTGGGCIAVIGSVAGDRGRQSNYVYGSAKAAIAAFASGLRNRYAKSGVHILTVKPGFTDTPMTYGMHSPLIASREAVAACIVKAMRRRRNVVYAPWFWRFIMAIIMHIPEPVFKRMKL